MILGWITVTFRLPSYIRDTYYERVLTLFNGWCIKAQVCALPICIELHILFKISNWDSTLHYIPIWNPCALLINVVKNTTAIFVACYGEYYICYIVLKWWNQGFYNNRLQDFTNSRFYSAVRRHSHSLIIFIWKHNMNSWSERVFSMKTLPQRHSATSVFH